MTNSEIIALLMPIFGAVAMTGTAFLVKWLFIGPKPKRKPKPKVDLSTARDEINTVIGKMMRVDLPTGQTTTMTTQMSQGRRTGEWLIRRDLADGLPLSREPKPTSYKD